MCFKPIQIFAFWDDAAHSWVARCEDIPEIAAKAESRQALSDKLTAIVLNLKKEYGGFPGAEVPVEVLWQALPNMPSHEDSAQGKMDRVRQIEREIATLRPDELAAFRDWFIAYDGEMWDRRIEADATAGKLDRLAEAAVAEHRTGKTTRW